MLYTSVRAVIEGQKLVVLPVDATVREAVIVMAEYRIGAVPVVRNAEMIGIFTERDLLNRVIALSLDPDAIRLEAVMTGNPTTIDADQTLYEAQNAMHRGGFRHLPVMENGFLIGMLSMRDVPTEYRLMRENWLSVKLHLPAQDESSAPE